MPVARTRKTKNNKKSNKRRTSGAPGASGPQAARPVTKRRKLAAALLAAVLVGVLMIGVLSAIGPPGGDEEGDAQEQGEVQPLPEGHPALDLARRDADDPLAVGPADAPVVMIEYVDFQDAFAGIHARGTHGELVEEYVGTGALRIEVRNFPINGPESDAAARAAWAAGQQDRFWEFHDAAFAEEFHRDSGRFDEDGVLALAEAADVPDLARFEADMASDEAGEAVGRDAQEAYDLGVTSTPSFLLNGQALHGARSADEFRDVIDQLYEAAE
ncbi:thioredoxin domain-containing protein [Streptomyces sp. MP131-18]|uniref:DsbA family protein n=1 Tax=Streptomyces sp. MP131-18 TaxID=1857892 RepID=UPI00097C4477|nr:thioredoxin domain-containing protein [Streptomyces sp. MP131-18]ONK11990.1 Thiol-disulfide oxidoreductase D [Streptomyces sp. MP131-18]